MHSERVQVYLLREEEERQSRRGNENWVARNRGSFLRLRYYYCVDRLISIEIFRGFTVLPKLLLPLRGPIGTDSNIQRSIMSPIFYPNIYVPPIFYPNMLAPPIFYPNILVPSIFYPNIHVPPIFYPDISLPPIFYPNIRVPPIFYPNIRASSRRQRFYTTTMYNTRARRLHRES